MKKYGKIEKSCAYARNLAYVDVAFRNKRHLFGKWNLSKEMRRGQGKRWNVANETEENIKLSHRSLSQTNTETEELRTRDLFPKGIQDKDFQTEKIVSLILQESGMIITAIIQQVWSHFCYFSLFMWRALAGPNCQSYLFLQSSSVVFPPIRHILPPLWLIYAPSKAQKAEENY